MDRDVTPDRIEAFLIAGYYGFLDYATASWPLHLRDIYHREDRDCENLAEDVEVFLGNHWTNSDSLDVNVTKTVQETLSAFKDCAFFDNLCLAFAFAKKQLSIYGQGPSEHEPLDLSEITNRIRQTLESFATSTSISSEQRTALQAFYGPNWFKCRRPNCMHYHQGLPTT